VEQLQKVNMVKTEPIRILLKNSYYIIPIQIGFDTTYVGVEEKAVKSRDLLNKSNENYPFKKNQ
jgi:hypothetical protein